MKLGKLLLGAAIGVGAVAAAPFTGGGSILAGASAVGSLAGGVAVASAVGAAGVGVGIGAAVSSHEESGEAFRRRHAKESGFSDGLAKAESDMKAKLMPIIADAKKRNDFILGLTAFGYAIANCDGVIAPEEVDELEFYLNHVKNDGTIPNSVKAEVTRIKDKKANFLQITNLLNEIDVENLVSFDEILENIISADGVESPEEIKLRADWSYYYDIRKA